MPNAPQVRRDRRERTGMRLRRGERAIGSVVFTATRAPASSARSECRLDVVEQRGSMLVDRAPEPRVVEAVVVVRGDIAGWSREQLRLPTCFALRMRSVPCTRMRRSSIRTCCHSGAGCDVNTRPGRSPLLSSLDPVSTGTESTRNRPGPSALSRLANAMGATVATCVGVQRSIRLVCSVSCHYRSVLSAVETE